MHSRCQEQQTAVLSVCVYICCYLCSVFVCVCARAREVHPLFGLVAAALSTTALYTLMLSKCCAKLCMCECACICMQHAAIYLRVCVCVCELECVCVCLCANSFSKCPAKLAVGFLAVDTTCNYVESKMHVKY